MVGLALLFGSSCLLLCSLPFVPILLRRRTLGACLVAGVVVTTLPLLLVNLPWLMASSGAILLNMLLSVGSMLWAGLAGGVVFWWIAFARDGTDTESE